MFRFFRRASSGRGKARKIGPAEAWRDLEAPREIRAGIRSSSSKDTLKNIR
jgi:hypothetical protein